MVTEKDQVVLLSERLTLLLKSYISQYLPTSDQSIIMESFMLDCGWRI